MLTRKGLSAGSKGSSETEATNSCPLPHTQQTCKHDTQPSAQPAQQEHPFSVEDVREALGYDRNDTSVTVTIKRADRLEDRDPMASVFASIFGGVTDAVTDADDPLLHDGQLESVIEEVVAEVQRAVAMHEPMWSPHEGYAVLKEQVDELWDAIKANDSENARKEAVQVAAMAIRYLLDIDPD
jgi:hypothetical protein